jgi:hypothetical protein
LVWSDGEHAGLATQDFTILGLRSATGLLESTCFELHGEGEVPITMSDGNVAELCLADEFVDCNGSMPLFEDRSACELHDPKARLPLSVVKKHVRLFAVRECLGPELRHAEKITVSFDVLPNGTLSEPALVQRGSRAPSQCLRLALASDWPRGFARTRVFITIVNRGEG